MIRAALVVGACVIVIGTTPPGGQPASAGPDKPVFTGLVVKLSARRTEAAEPAAAIVGGLKERLPGGRTVWSDTQLDAAGTMYRFRPVRLESAGDADTSAATAWEDAHQLRRDPSVELAEPAFLVEGAKGETVELEDCQAAIGRVAESGGDAAALPGAAADSQWSLGPLGANVLEAWKQFPQGQLPGHGVWVGHPDTGYRQHPEIWQPNGPVQPGLGWNFLEINGDPLDVMSTGNLKHPGHGTRTASVIISPPGRQLGGGSASAISGVAPGARLIPLRVANSVVQIDQTNLAAAIRAASGDDRTEVKQKVDVISISLGGPPSRTLKDAVESAERRGVVVLAAAGNEVRLVVWPARYENVIGVAASNADSKPWRGSSSGRAVAITAPGESVWVASPRHNEPAPLDCLQMGSGTSYAVATTAGIAALWIARHSGNPAFQALRTSGRQTEAFRRILRENVRQVPGWDTSRFGPGIVDAVKALNAPLPRLPESAPKPADRCSRDLEALESVFDETPDPRARIGGLFGTSPCQVAMLADEVAFLYASDVGVRDALGGIVTDREPSTADYERARDALRQAGSRSLAARLPSR